MPLSLSIRDLGGPLCTLSAELTWKVLRVKQALKTSLGIPVCEQRLILDTIELKNTHVLQDYFANTDALCYSGDLIADLTLVRRSPEQAEWLRKVRSHAALLGEAPESVRANREVVVAAVKQDAQVLKFASSDLCADCAVVTTAVSSCWDSLQYAAQELRSDRAFILHLLRDTSVSEVGSIVQWNHALVATGMVEKRGSMCVLEHVAADLHVDREIVLAALYNDWRALNYIPADLWLDNDFIVEWSVRTLSSLRLVQSDLWSNPDLVVGAITRNWAIFEHAPLQVRLHPDLVLATMANDWEVLQYAAANFCAEGAFSWKAAERLLKSEPILESAPAQLQANRDFVLAAVAEQGRELKHAPVKFHNDREVVLLAVRKNGLALEFAGAEFRKDKEVANAAVASDGRALEFVHPELQTPELVLQAVSTDSRGLMCYAAQLVKDPDFSGLAAFVKYAITLRSQAFQCDFEAACMSL